LGNISTYACGRGSKATVWVLPKNPNILGSGFFTAEFIEKKLTAKKRTQTVVFDPHLFTLTKLMLKTF